jgi:hypothetical protein
MSAMPVMRMEQLAWGESISSLAFQAHPGQPFLISQPQHNFVIARQSSQLMSAGAPDTQHQ